MTTYLFKLNTYCLNYRRLFYFAFIIFFSEIAYSLSYSDDILAQFNPQVKILSREPASITIDLDYDEAPITEDVALQGFLLKNKSNDLKRAEINITNRILEDRELEYWGLLRFGNYPDRDEDYIERNLYKYVNERMKRAVKYSKEEHLFLVLAGVEESLSKKSNISINKKKDKLVKIRYSTNIVKRTALIEVSLIGVKYYLIHKKGETRLNFRKKINRSSLLFFEYDIRNVSFETKIFKTIRPKLALIISHNLNLHNQGEKERTEIKFEFRYITLHEFS